MKELEKIKNTAYCPTCGAHRLFGAHHMGCCLSIAGYALGKRAVLDWENRLAQLSADLAEAAPEMVKRQRERAAKVGALSMAYTLA